LLADDPNRPASVAFVFDTLRAFCEGTILHYYLKKKMSTPPHPPPMRFLSISNSSYCEWAIAIQNYKDLTIGCISYDWEEIRRDK